MKFFETFINNNSRYKTQFHSEFFELEILEIFTIAFLLKIIIGTLSSVIKCSP